jgi:hypothetical protein
VARKLLFTVLLGLALIGVRDLIVMAQSAMTPPGRYISSDEWHKGMKLGNNGILGGYTFPVAGEMVIRKRMEGKNNASIHGGPMGDKDNSTEIAYILEGSGTFMTGGTWVDQKDRTKGIRGGEAHDLKPGDVVVIPPGTAHWFSKINGSVTMIEVRFPGDVSKAN